MDGAMSAQRRTSYSRIQSVLQRYRITDNDVIARQQACAVGGRKPVGDIFAWTLGPGTVAAMLELVAERSRQGGSANG